MVEMWEVGTVVIVSLCVYDEYIQRNSNGTPIRTFFSYGNVLSRLLYIPSPYTHSTHLLYPIHRQSQPFYISSMPSYSTLIENIIRDAGIISNAAIKKKMKALGKQNTPTIRKALKTMLKKGTLVKEGASYRLKHATSAEANDAILRAKIKRDMAAKAKARTAVKMERRYLHNARKAGGLSKRAKENVLWLKKPPSL